MGRITNNVKETIDMVSKANPGYSKPYIFASMARNMSKYNLTFVDYRKGNFINMTKEEKKDFLPLCEYQALLDYLDNPKYTEVFVDKILFNKVFRDYVKRDFIDLRVSTLDEFKKFVKGKKVFFAKPHNLSGGKGVEKITNKNLDLDEVYQQLLDNKQFLVEEAIIQHNKLDDIYAKSVNNVRIVTLLKDKEVNIIAMCLRMGYDDKEELVSSEDLYCTLNESGKILTDGCNDYLTTFEKHPISGFKFKGSKIPYMKEAIELVKKAALEVPEVRYVGWDVGIAEDGPVIIEGNFYPSFGLHQYYLTNEDYWLKKKVKNILGNEFDKIDL